MSYPGGKAGSGTYQKIINQIPPHETFISPFLGRCGIMRKKRPAAESYGFDIDPGVIDWWATQNYEIQVAEKDGLDWLLSAADAVRNGGRIHPLNDGAAVPQNLALNVPGADVNLGGVRSAMMYCDPPYPLETRSKKKVYLQEWGDLEHIALLNAICSLDCMVAVSTYPNARYSSRLHKWRRIEFQSMTRGGLRTEHLYMNYPEPQELHDYQYLGANRRDRERISRKQARWLKNFKALPILEQRAILNQIKDHG